MIDAAFLHLPGIGPVRREQLLERGVARWQDLLARPETLPPASREAALQQCERDLTALQVDDIGHFVRTFAPPDRWRILSHFLANVSFFDIETAGLEVDDPITLIICWHQGSLHTFVEHENLDDFLELLTSVRLLSSFNGSSFDVPRVLDTFHIPELPCPHLDLRWLCYHAGLTGGLKQITARLGIMRPDDLHAADGELAIRLWARWHHFADQVARAELVRYCASDVLLLVALAHSLAKLPLDVETLWQQLPAASSTPPSQVKTNAEELPSEGAFGTAHPMRLRGHRRRVG